ncbi:MAG: peptidyl-tRNA hydrolase [Propionibacterium sp.]|nr:peptidyl-tRNA hydrolase [Propionibacterium sp.]
MQIAVLVDKARPAGHIATCEAAARAVVSLLDDPRATGGEWRDAVEYWRDGRIRKLVRRARGVRWTEVHELPGVTITQGLAAARAFIPGPVDPLPRPLAKLQVEGTELPDDRASDSGEAIVRIGISPLIDMTTGKSAAQCGHAAQLALDTMDADTLARWRADGFRVRVERIAAEEWSADPGRVQVIDAGFTELDGPTETTRAWW